MATANRTSKITTTNENIKTKKSQQRESRRIDEKIVHFSSYIAFVGVLNIDRSLSCLLLTMSFFYDEHFCCFVAIIFKHLAQTASQRTSNKIAGSFRINICSFGVSKNHQKQHVMK